MRKYIPCKYCETLIFFHKRQDGKWDTVEETGELHRCLTKKEYKSAKQGNEIKKWKMDSNTEVKPVKNPNKQNKLGTLTPRKIVRVQPFGR
jgi:hypothetical protein